MELIATHGVTRSFPVADGEDFFALKGIGITVPRGKLTILRGRSGSGKTTLMNILGGLDYPTAGEVFFEGQDIALLDEDARRLLRRYSMGFVFQSVALVPIMTAYENVEFALRMAEDMEQSDQRVRECLRLVGLEGRMSHLPQQLSGGEQQRVAIARAIAHKPAVIFADEPTAELDTNSGLQVMKIFKQLIDQEKITIVMSTHDIRLMELGDQVYELEDGEIIGSQTHEH